MGKCLYSPGVEKSFLLSKYDRKLRISDYIKTKPKIEKYQYDESNINNVKWKKKRFKLGTKAHNCYLSTQETEASLGYIVRSR
jgi:hypothetical protein